MARIGLNVAVSGYTGELLIVWREVIANDPTPPETGRSDAFAFPYDAVYSINDINPVVHLVELWRSDDGVTLDELIKRWEIDASIYNEISSNTYQYQVDRGYDNTAPVATGSDVWADPENEDVNLTDERLDGATQDELYVVEAGYGPLLNSEYELLAGGGITLLNGRTFNNGTAWFITRYQVVAQQVVVSTSNLYEGVEVVSEDRDLYVSASDNLYNKLVIADAAGNVVTVTFPDLSTIPDNKKVTFNTHNGSQKYLVLQFDTGDTVSFFGQDKNVLYLAKGEEITLYFKGGVCYVVSYHGRYLQRGSVWADWYEGRVADNGAHLKAITATGVLSADDYPGLYEFITGLSVGTVALADWATGNNKRKYGINTLARTFRVPDLTNISRRFLKMDGSDVPGRYEADAVGPFTGTFTVPKGYSYTGAPNNTRFGNGSNNPQNQSISMAVDTGNTETTVKNYGEVPLIIL